MLGALLPLVLLLELLAVGDLNDCTTRAAQFSFGLIAVDGAHCVLVLRAGLIGSDVAYVWDICDTLSLAQAARAAAGARCTPTLSAVLAAREALGHAHAGDRVAARTALRLARVETERGQSEDDPLWLQFWSPADLACHETRTALALGDLGLAERSARTALASADERRFPRNHAIYSVRLGDVLTKAGKLDEAIAVTSDAVKRSDQLAGSRRISDDLAAVLAALSIKNYPPAKCFARAAQQWVSAP